MHGGELYSTKWFQRQRGEGPFAKQLAETFKLFKRKHALDGPLPKLNEKAFTRNVTAPLELGQLGLFQGQG